MGTLYQTHSPLTYKVQDVTSFVEIGRGLDARIEAFLKNKAPDKLCVITDTLVADLHEPRLREILGLAGIPQYWCRLEPGEHSKTLPKVYAVLEEILPEMTRDSLIIAFGGGVVGNLSGTVASLLFRRCDFIHIPTTFMAQADSAIGIKQAVNGTYSKNAYGSYHTPLAVFNDIGFLDTLPPFQWRNGLAESIKVAVARSPDFAVRLKSLLKKFPHFSDDEIWYLLEETIQPKLAGLTDDPFEKNSLLFLEIGHTIGHALERASGGEILHGTAISIGMLIEAQIGIQLGLTRPVVYQELAALFSRLSFPNKIPGYVKVADIMKCLACDNRRIASGPIFVFPTVLGQTVTHAGIDLDLVRSTLEQVVDR